MALDPAKLDAFLGKFVGDLGAAMHAGTVVLGEQLGLYKALAAGPMTSAELAQKTSTSERYVREWLAAQAASGYVMYDPAKQNYYLTEEQAFALATEGSPAYVPGAFQLTLGALRSVPKLPPCSAAAWASAGTSITNGCSRVRRNSSARVTRRTWYPAGSPRSKAWRRS